MTGLWTVLGIGSDVLIVAFLWWRGHGRPLPAGLEWMRRNPALRWIFTIRDKPVLAGF